MTSLTQPRSPAPGRPRPSWRAVGLPSEHGGWGLTLEPVVLGLLVTASWSGLALGAAALVAFVARTPLKVVLVDRWRHRSLPRTRVALRLAAGELVALVVLVGLATRSARGPFWIPLLMALPLIGVELWFDMRSRSRRLVPELAGSVGIGAVAAAIVVAGGGGATLAAAAWLVVGARAVASVPFVRYQLARGHHRPARRWAQDLAQLAAVGLVVGGRLVGWLPWAAAGAVVALAVAQVVLARLRPPRAVIVGVQQLVFGLAVVLTAGWAMASA